MKISNIIVFTLSLLHLSCKQDTKKGIEGNNNTGNTVIIGDRNVVKTTRPAISEFISVAISIDNDILNKRFGIDPEDYDNQIELKTDYLTYDSRSHLDTLIITPNLDYLELFRNHGPIGPTEGITNNEYNHHFFVQYPNIDIKIVNNSDETIFFNKAILEVVDSKVDLEPLIVIDQLQNLSFSLFKDSWADFTKCIVKYNFYPIDTKNIDYNYLPFTKNIIAINATENISINVKEDIKKFGFDFNTFYKYPPSADNNYSVAAMGKLKPLKILKEDDFPNIRRFEDYYQEIIIAGVIYFEYIDYNGKTQSDYVKFHSKVGLSEYGEGGGGEDASFQYETMLKSVGAGYTVEKNISQYVEPKGIDRFNILLGADKSSVHSFKLKLVYNNKNVIESEPINLTLFFPRSSKGLLDGLYKQKSHGELPTNNQKRAKVWVDNLNLRESPNLQSRVLSKIKINSTVVPLGEKSKNKYNVMFRGNQYSDYFYKVLTSKNEVGWIHGAALK